MNWLNRLDDVLDKALTPQNSRHGNSPSAIRGQLSKSADHVAEKFGNESDSSHGSPVILPSRSLEVVGPSIPGRVRRRSEGIAIPAPGNQTKPAISNLSRPVIPGKLKRNRSKEVAEKQTQYPGNVKRITIPKNRAEEDQQSSESEVELPSSEVLPLASQRSRNEMEYQHSENVRLSNEAFDELNKVQTIVSGEMAPVENQALAKTVHDEKQRGPEQMQQVTDNKASDKLLQTDQSSTQISASKVVESIGSLAKTKAWGFLQVNSFDRTSRENEVLINNLETCSAEASELRINEHSDSVKVGPPFTSDAIETIIVPKTKSDKGREPLSRNENRGENGGIAVALFSDERHEMRLEPSQKDIVGPSDVEKIREANKLSSLPSRNCEQFQSAVDNAEKAVQGSLVLTQEAGETANDLSAGESASKHLDQAENDPPVRNSGHLHLSAAAVTPQSEPMADDKVPAFKVVDGAHERLIKEQGKQSIKETSVREFSQSHVLPNDEPSARVRNYPKHGHPGNGELLALPKSQDNSFEAPGFVDSSSIAKVPSAWNGSVNASERGIDSPHMSASLTKTDPDVDSTVSMWSSFKLDMPFDRSRNCHGMVNLRLVRARRLSCSTGSFVQGNISLKPWKGKVRTTTTRTYAGSRGHGVCAVWDDCEENHVSMIHSFSSDESPIPTIEIDLTVSPLGMGLLGFSMGTLSLSCEELFMNPSRTRRYWLTTPETKTIPSPVRLASPMLQVEAMFEPTIVEEETTDEDKNVPPDIIDIPKDVLTFQRANSSGLEEYPSTPVRLGSTGGARADDNACSTPLSDRTPPFSAKSQRSLHSQTNQHLLCLKKFRLPATCCVCKKSIMSGIRSQAAYRCEKCGIDCCEDCVLQVDIRMPCGSLLAQDVAKNSIQNKLSMNTILSTVAPVSGNVTSPQRDTHPSSHCVSLNESKGIGTIDLVFLRAFVLDEPWSPESDAADILTSGKTSFKAGDYYMRITRVGSKDSARTQTIQNSSKPVFDSKEMILNV